MIASTDIANIIYRDCEGFGLPRYQGGNVPCGAVEEYGRVVIHSKEQSYGSTWRKSFVEVNVIVPDTPGGNADLVRINSVEREGRGLLVSAGRYDGTPYRYRVESTSVQANEQLKAHRVNFRLTFEALNTID